MIIILVNRSKKSEEFDEIWDLVKMSSEKKTTKIYAGFLEKKYHF